MNSENTVELKSCLSNYPDVDELFDDWLKHINKYNFYDRIRYLQWRELEREFNYIFSEIEKEYECSLDENSDFRPMQDICIQSNMLMMKAIVVVMRIRFMRKMVPLFADKMDKLFEFSNRFKRLLNSDNGLMKWPVDCYKRIEEEFSAHKNNTSEMFCFEPDFFYYHISSVIPSLMLKRNYKSSVGLSSDCFPKVLTPQDFIYKDMDKSFHLIMEYLSKEIINSHLILELDEVNFSLELDEFRSSIAYEFVLEKYEKKLGMERDGFIKLLGTVEDYKSLIDSYIGAKILDDLDSLGSKVARESIEKWINLLTVAALLQDNEERQSSETDLLSIMIGSPEQKNKRLERLDYLIKNKKGKFVAELMWTAWKKLEWFKEKPAYNIVHKRYEHIGAVSGYNKHFKEINSDEIDHYTKLLEMDS